MILLDDVMQVLALPVFRLCCQCFIGFQRFDCHGVSRVLVHRHHSWCLSVFRFQHFPKEPGGSLPISLRAQHEVQRVTH